jgi:hypothetical protein
MNPLYTLPFQFFCFNIPSTTMSAKWWSLCLRFSHQNHGCISLLSYATSFQQSHGFSIGQHPTPLCHHSPLYIPEAFAWMNLGKLQETSVRIAGTLAEIRTQHFPNMSQEGHCYTNSLSVPIALSRLPYLIKVRW